MVETVDVPLEAVTVTVLEPPGVLADVAIVRVLVPFGARDAGEKLAVAPAGSPLTASAVVPEAAFATVMVLVPLREAMTVSVAADLVTVMALGAVALTTRVTAAVLLTVPLDPVIVTGYVPATTEDVVVTVNVVLPDAAIDAGLKAAEAPAGRPVAANVTALLKPLSMLSATVYVADAPGVTVAEAGVAVSE